MSHTPDFSQFEKVLQNQVPDRPVLFELFLNDQIYTSYAGRPAPAKPGSVDVDDEYLAYLKEFGAWYGDAYTAAGYDHVSVQAGIMFPALSFRQKAHVKEKSVSQNEGAVLLTRQDVEAFPWPDASDLDMRAVDAITERMPQGIGAMPLAPMGVLENLVELIGYDNLCYMLVDDRALVKEIADRIGSILFDFYRTVAVHPGIRGLIYNDDWGYKTQTMVAPDDLREFVFPWVKKYAELAHNASKPIMLHSCGQLQEVMDDIIDDIGIDAKHSFEDVITPVEEMYERWGDRIAILGGIDVDFLCTAEISQIKERSQSMVERTATRGGYALGSGNSIPEYIPRQAYQAMTGVVTENR